MIAVVFATWLFLDHLSEPPAAGACCGGGWPNQDLNVLTHLPPPAPLPPGWLATLRPGVLPDSNIVWVVVLGSDFVEPQLLTGELPAELEAFHTSLQMRQGGRLLSGRVDSVQTALHGFEGALARVLLDAPLEASPVEMVLVRGAGAPVCGPQELIPGEIYASTEAERARCWSRPVTDTPVTVEVQHWRNRETRWRPFDFHISPAPGVSVTPSDSCDDTTDHRLAFEFRAGRDVLFFEGMWLDDDGVHSTVIVAGDYIHSPTRAQNRIRRAIGFADLHSPLSHMFLRAITVSGERQGLWVYEVSSGQLQRWTPALGIPVPESPFDALF